MHKTILYEDINDVELRYDVSYGTRTGGIADSRILTGNFRNDEFGNYHLAVNRDVDACIVVFTEGKTKVFNLHSNEETESFFLILQFRTSGSMDPTDQMITALSLQINPWLSRTVQTSE